MMTKDLQVKMFWMSMCGQEGVLGKIYTQDRTINDWLSENPDREIERVDYTNGRDGTGGIVVIWHRKIDPDFRNRRGPEA